MKSEAGRLAIHFNLEIALTGRDFAAKMTALSL
jgi:hypothetical protein